MSKLADFAIITILLGAALCLIIPSLLRLQHLSRSRKRSTRNDAPYSAKPMPVRAKAVAPIAKVTAFRWQSLINLKVPSAETASTESRNRGAISWRKGSIWSHSLRDLVECHRFSNKNAADS